MIRDINVKLDPARTVIERFSTTHKSGVVILAEILAINYSSVYRWQEPKRRNGKGSGGAIPSRYLVRIKREADRRKIDLPWEVLTGASIAQGAHHGTQ